MTIQKNGYKKTAFALIILITVFSAVLVVIFLGLNKTDKSAFQRMLEIRPGPDFAGSHGRYSSGSRDEDPSLQLIIEPLGERFDKKAFLERCSGKIKGYDYNISESYALWDDWDENGRQTGGKYTTITLSFIMNGKIYRISTGSKYALNSHVNANLIEIAGMVIVNRNLDFPEIYNLCSTAYNDYNVSYETMYMQYTVLPTGESNNSGISINIERLISESDFIKSIPYHEFTLFEQGDEYRTLYYKTDSYVIYVKTIKRQELTPEMQEYFDFWTTENNLGQMIKELGLQ